MNPPTMPLPAATVHDRGEMPLISATREFLQTGPSPQLPARLK